jgi:1-aminocyclopropane-1-carboxylate deaminase/D-cysteine desulfhydrase-like pyridoxal-dependent ACC family enzyme
MFPPSTISEIILDGRSFLVKRDELVHPYLQGNKYRKLHTLLQAPKETFSTIISYGGTQSNAMLAIASMCQEKGWRFLYYTKPLSTSQKSETSGNYYLARKLGMEHIEIELELYKSFISSLRPNFDPKTFIIDQGGAIDEAKAGIEVLAQEITKANPDIQAVATPSGTGTTAIFLALLLPNIKVYTVPCVGDTDYLKKEMSALCTIPKNLIILQPKKKFHFAKLYDEFLAIYNKTLQAGIEFDLLYSPSLWIALLEQTDDKILYIHSGGTTGNATMLERYRRKLSQIH